MSYFVIILGPQNIHQGGTKNIAIKYSRLKKVQIWILSTKCKTKKEIVT